MDTLDLRAPALHASLLRLDLAFGRPTCHANHTGPAWGASRHRAIFVAVSIYRAMWPVAIVSIIRCVTEGHSRAGWSHDDAAESFFACVEDERAPSRTQEC